MDFLDLTAVPQTDPLPLYRYRDGLYAADLLAAAIVELDLFTWLADKPSALGDICAHFDIHDRPADVMITLFCAMGLLSRRGEVVETTLLAREHLVRQSPWYLGPYYASLKDRPVCQDFIRVLRTGKPANWGSFKSEKDWAKAMEDPRFASQFTAAMDCRGVYLAQALAKKLDLSRFRRLLDIAGGSGIYACSLTAAHPSLTAAVFEKAPVDRIAEQCVRERGFSERVCVLAGDMFSTPLPAGFDLHLYSNVLHDWDVPAVERLLAASFAALEPGGMLIVHDAHINADRNGPLPVAAYSAMLMHATEGKCYSILEMEELLKAAGFTGFHFETTVVDRSFITARKPPR